ncbi:MAG: hypothetical protein IJT99_01285 [Clostridia bacterium]|nr:hypothetical protein [Clostridia bacterium]
MDAWQIIDWVSAAIDENEWTPNEAAEQLGISLSGIHYIKKKQHMPRLDSLVIILDNLGYELDIVRKGESRVMFQAELHMKNGTTKLIQARSMKGITKRIEQEQNLKSYKIRAMRIDQIRQGSGVEYVE